jgi:hypothetical protein
LKPFGYIDLVEIFCRDDPRFRAEWLYLTRFIKPVVKIPAHSGLGIHFGAAGSGYLDISFLVWNDGSWLRKADDRRMLDLE